MLWSRAPRARVKLLALNAARCRGYFEELDRIFCDRTRSTGSLLVAVLFWPYAAVLLVPLAVYATLLCLLAIPFGCCGLFEAARDSFFYFFLLPVLAVFALPFIMATFACGLPIGVVLPYWCLIEITYRRCF